MGFEELGKKLAQLGQDTKSGVQKMSESYQVNAKLGEEKKTLHKLYAALGKEIYQKYEQAPPEGLEEEFEAIKASGEKISQLSEQLGKLKNVIYCTECGKESSRGEQFCSRCGAKLPEAEEDMKEKMKRDVKEAAGEAGIILDDLAGKTRSFVGGMADKADAFAKGVASRMNKNKAEEEIVDMPWEEAEESSEEAAPEMEEKNEACGEAEAEQEMEPAGTEPETEEAKTGSSAEEAKTEGESEGETQVCPEEENSAGEEA